MNTGQYVLKHFKSLMIPYFGYSAIVILYNILVGLMKGKDYEWIWQRFILQGYTTVSLRGISALWFLPSLFIAQILFILIIRTASGFQDDQCCSSGSFMQVCFSPAVTGMGRKHDRTYV